jgi:DNA (cytosine-5)-methyltransferase 1
MKKIRVVELFAGVGGFRLGLEGYNGMSASSNYEKPLNSSFEVVWSNQYEPLTPSKQHASWVYEKRWPNANHSGQDIEKVIENDFNSIPDHDLLVGGFPCQDYSVATSLKNSKGLVGKKGVLWWSIYNIIQKKGKNKPNYLFLENVDRLLSSPASQRGRDFAVMLSCLYEQGYAVEWRIINAADYGMPQRRRRIYIVAYHKNSPIYEKLSGINNKLLIEKDGIISSAFPVKINEDYKEFKISKDFDLESKNFNKNGKLSPFRNSGYMKDGEVITVKSTSNYNGDLYQLIDALEPLPEIDEFYIDKDKPVKRAVIEQIDGSEKIIETVWDKWEYLKGPKNQYKYNKAQGYKYKYSEGKMDLLDSLEKPSRTIITGEGGASPSRFKHLIMDPITNKERRLRPVELEKLNMFPKDHTVHDDVTDTKRAFFMGNALVVGVVEKIGAILSKINDC